MVHLLRAVLPSLLVAIVNGATYSLSDNIVGSDFLSTFTHQAIADPTHGRVNYLSQADALAKNITYANGNTFIMRADDTTVLSASGPGRNAVRIQSNAQYTTHVVVTWPAAWEVGDNWPNNGEVDIVEGVNGVAPNAATLHTSSGCTMPSSTTQTGITTGTDCNAADNGNAGCGVQCNKANSFAAGFNGAGGGWYAMERTNSAIKVWFWSRTDSTVPSDVKNGASTVNTSNWGTPFADFPNTNCNMTSHFGPNNIVINLTFCGDWAGNVFTSQGCGSDCVSFVNENPSAFTQAYWDFASLAVYQ
ncbi:hypothetical protein Clacol_000757 [Clathrus columnatus]|uniref:GH16 domain-containing protein n=1 Tax=Clathrus columnatus TaxID=1419009 RepID=A0AAV5A1F7_9AGAM|nr:hypothetical protein Clacol_000757 [Clathrus columnatus]